MKVTVKTAVKNTTQLNAEEILNGRFHHTKKGWINANFADKDKAIEMIAGVLGGRKRSEILAALNYRRPSHWGLRRIFFSLDNKGELRCSYCAGQDYPWELNQIRKYLYNL